MGRVRRRLVIAAALHLALVPYVAAAERSFQDFAPEHRPAPRTAHTMTYHAGLEMVVVFGGNDAAGRPLADLWGWNGESWRLLDDGEGGPPPRSRHAMAYDAREDRIVIHGGGTVDEDLGDTWAWSVSQGWKTLPGDGPGARSHHHMAFDPSTESIILYGGGREGDEFGSDTWRLAGDGWRATEERLRPGRVLAGTATADAGMFLYGGLVRGEGRSAELWAWRDGRWLRVDDAGPRGLIYPGLAWDPNARELVLFGGEADEGMVGETWRWSESGWSPVPGESGPPARTEHAMAYDAARGVGVLFGGETSAGAANDVWEWDGAAWTRADIPGSTDGWVDRIGTPQYFAVIVRDLDAAVEWYRNVFGLEQWIGSEADDGRWRIVNLRSESLLVELIRHDEARTVDRAHGFFKVGFHVPDIEAIADRVERARGERPSTSEFPRFGLRVLQLRDPDGNIIQVHAWLE